MGDSSLTVAAGAEKFEHQFEQHRAELTAYCYRMLGSPFEAEDAVQETFIRAWRGLEGFEGRAACAPGSTGSRRTSGSTCSRGESAARGRWTSGRRTSPIESNLNIPARGDLDRADSRRRSGRPGRGGRVARDDPPRVRRRAAAPPAATAGGADPLRGAALEGDRGRRAPRHERRVGQQRAPARAGDARREQPERGRHVASVDEADAELLARYVEAFEQYDMDALTVADPGGRDAVDAAVRPVAERPRRHLRVVVRAGRRLPRLAGDPDRRRERLARVRPVQAERDRRAATTRGRCRCSRSRGGRIVEFTFFLDTDPLFPLFGLPPRLDA